MTKKKKKRETCPELTRDRIYNKHINKVIINFVRYIQEAGKNLNKFNSNIESIKKISMKTSRNKN